MRSLLFSMLLFALCLFVTSSAQQNNVTAYTADTQSNYTHADSISPPDMPPILIGIARITKYLYTRDTVFEYEKTDTLK